MCSFVSSQERERERESEREPMQTVFNVSICLFFYRGVHKSELKVYKREFLIKMIDSHSVVVIIKQSIANIMSATGFSFMHNPVQQKTKQTPSHMLNVVLVRTGRRRKANPFPRPCSLLIARLCATIVSEKPR
jgi:hypothetical protein